MNMHPKPTPARIEPKALRQTLGCFPTGVAVATAFARNGAPIGVTISSFNSVSMDPPLVLWSLARTAGSLPEFRAHGGFAINILSETQAELARRFAGSDRDRFSGLDWTTGLHGSPVIGASAAVLECRTYALHEGGDHEILLGEVLAHDASDRTPLVFGKGQLGGFAVNSAA